MADDATGAGKLKKLKVWWDKIIQEDTKLGYFVNESKSWLILKNPDELVSAQNIFENSSIKITTAGKRHLGAALGSQDFKKEYISEKIEQWMKEIEKLEEIAESQPQAAYSAYVHGYQHKFRYFLRTIADIREELKPLDELITNKLIPSIIGSQLSEMERDLLSLPVSHGGMGLNRPLLFLTMNTHGQNRLLDRWLLLLLFREILYQMQMRSTRRKKKPSIRNLRLSNRSPN